MTTPHGTSRTEPFWTPDPDTAADSRLADFGRWAARHRDIGTPFDPTDYAALHRWSVNDLEGF